jgi:methionyl-tRNA formyltransferase
MTDLKIVFMGTPDFAVAILGALLEKKYSIVGVVTAPDKPAGRGRKIKESAIKTFAKEKGLPILQPTNLKEDGFLQELKALDANLQIVVAFRMLPKAVWNMPEFGTFNLHASLLPDYRGAAPIHWAIINGETKTGVTTFFLDDKIDTGEVILQEETTIAHNDTVGKLHDKLMHMGSILVLKTVRLIENNKVLTWKQPEKISKPAYKIHTATCKIDWDQSLDSIANHIRGLNPFPAAWCELSNNGILTKIKIYDIEKEYGRHSLKNGEILVHDKTIKIATDGGYLKILSLQLAGKKRMSTNSFLNGYHLPNGSKLV